MPLKMLKFRSIEEATVILNGGLIGGNANGYFTGLIGLTINFTLPLGSHTFTQPTTSPPGSMKLSEVKAQLEAAIANLKVRKVGDNIAFTHATPGSAVSIPSTDQAAKSILGFDRNTAIVGRVINGAGGSVPKFADMTVEGGVIYVMIEE